MFFFYKFTFSNITVQIEKKDNLVIIFSNRSETGENRSIV